MNSISKLRWNDVLNDILFSSQLKFEWVNFEFQVSDCIYNRDGLYVHGEFGLAEATPLPRYFDREIECLLGAMDTVSKAWPKEKREDIETNALVSTKEDINESLLGTNCIKVKVHAIKDCDLVKQVRDFCGPRTKIRIDCNGLFNVDDALAVINSLTECDLELVEQPCRTNEENAQIRRRIEIPLAIDETARTHDEIEEAKKLGSADIVVAKVQPSGGIHKAVDLIDNWGGQVYVSHMMESQVGIDVGIALAKSLDELNYACGLQAPKLKKIFREPLNI